VPCGQCAECRRGEPNLCPSLAVLGNSVAGGLADRVRAPVASIYGVPPGLDLDAAMLAEPLAVGVHGVELAGVRPGERVLVLGAGAIGLLTAFAAARAGAEVVVSARHPHQRRAAERLGAREVLGTDPAELRSALRTRRPDVVLETVGGSADTVDVALRVVGRGGRIVVLGVFTRPLAVDPLRLMMKEVRLIGAMTYCRRGARPDFASALTLLAGERDLLASVITHRVTLDEAARGFALAADKASGAIKVAVAPR
jgi:2-desacetyl-2-hydroxyethyl bacteriochlorophyllide A dehydrogenase